MGRCSQDAELEEGGRAVRTATRPTAGESRPLTLGSWPPHPAPQVPGSLEATASMEHPRFLVETVTKSSPSRGSSYSSIPKFSLRCQQGGDAGPWLSQAFVGQKELLHRGLQQSRQAAGGAEREVVSRVGKCARTWGQGLGVSPSRRLSRHQYDDGGRARAQDPCEEVYVEAHGEPGVQRHLHRRRKGTTSSSLSGATRVSPGSPFKVNVP